MLRAATWAAVSSKRQAEDDKVSLDVQKQAGQAKAKELGYTIVEVLTVPGKSRNIILFEDATKEIPAYARLRELVDRREIDLLIFYNKSRLARTLALGETIVAYCQAQDVAVYDLSAPPSTLDARKQKRSSGDVLIGAVSSAAAQNDNTQRTVAHESGMIGRVQSGEMPGKVPFGYRKVYQENGAYHLVIDEDAAETLRIAFDEYLKGRGIAHVAEILKEQGRATPDGGTWCKGTLKNIYARVWVYAGYVEVNRISAHRAYTKAEGRQPAIISKEIATQFMAERADRNKKRRAIGAGNYLYSRLVTCGQCNTQMTCDGSTAVFVSKRTGKVSKHQNIRCKNCRKTLSFNVLREMLEDEFIELSERASAQGDDYVSHSGEHDTDAIEQAITNLQGEQKAAAKSIERAHRAYTDGLMDYKTYKGQVKRLQAQEAQQGEQLDLLRSRLMAVRTRQARASEIVELADIAVEMLNHPDVAAANAWLREYWEVTFTEDREIEVRQK